MPAAKKQKTKDERYTERHCLWEDRDTGLAWYASQMPGCYQKLITHGFLLLCISARMKQHLDSSGKECPHGASTIGSVHVNVE